MGKKDIRKKSILADFKGEKKILAKIKPSLFFKNKMVNKYSDR